MGLRCPECEDVEFVLIAEQSKLHGEGQIVFMKGECKTCKIVMLPYTSLPKGSTQVFKCLEEIKI